MSLVKETGLSAAARIHADANERLAVRMVKTRLLILRINYSPIPSRRHRPGNRLIGRKVRAGVRAVEHRLRQFLNMHRAFPIRLLQAAERGVSIAKPRMDDGNVQRRDVSLLRQRLEFVEDA